MTFIVNTDDKAAVQKLIDELTAHLTIKLRPATQEELESADSGTEVFVRTFTDGDGALNSEGEVSTEHAYYQLGDVFIEVK